MWLLSFPSDPHVLGSNLNGFPACHATVHPAEKWIPMVVANKDNRGWHYVW